MKLFADGASLDTMLAMHEQYDVKGFTTNPTLCRQAGVSNYWKHAAFLVDRLPPELSLSFEVVGTTPMEMMEQALYLSSLGPTMFVKIPVMLTTGRRTVELIDQLRARGVQVNVTALTSAFQFGSIARALTIGATPEAPGPACYISMFAGRIADTGKDPVPIMAAAASMLANLRTSSGTDCQLIWASTREVLNLVQAEESGVDIITVTPAILAKRDCLGIGLEPMSLNIVRQFARDAEEAGYSASPSS